MTTNTSTSSSDTRSLVAFLVGTVALIALLTALGGWPLPVVIFAILFMVMAHEFGHYITAKRAGMKVTDFFVGFGPVIWSITKGDTRYGVRALPFGGFVKVPGMTWTDEIPANEEKRTYRSASYPKKVLFASAGSLMHVVLAFVLAWASLTFIGTQSTSDVGVQSFTQWTGHAKNVAQLAGIKVGDRIEAIDGHRITSVAQLSSQVRDSVGKRLSITVERGGQTLILHATPVAGSTIKAKGVKLDKTGGYLGVDLTYLTQRTPWYSAIPRSFHVLGSTIAAAYTALVHIPGQFPSLLHQVASPAAAENRHNQLTRPESIVGVVRLTVQGTKSNSATLFELLIIVNIFVGVLNMLPMLPLDGGYVAIATYERLRSRRGSRYHADVNLLAPFAYAFMAALLVLFATTLYLDIVHPIANPFN